jgi:hypothetical protein
MRRALALAILLVLQGAFAYGASLDAEIRRLAGLVKANASVRTESYDVRNFSMKAEVEKIHPRFSALDKQCDLQPVVGRDDVIPVIGLFDAFLDNADKVEALVERLNKGRKLIGAVGYFWDGMKGPEGECSEEHLAMYFSNGKALIIESDY